MPGLGICSFLSPLSLTALPLSPRRPLAGAGITCQAGTSSSGHFASPRGSSPRSLSPTAAQPVKPSPLGTGVPSQETVLPSRDLKRDPLLSKSATPEGQALSEETKGPWWAQLVNTPVDSWLEGSKSFHQERDLPAVQAAPAVAPLLRPGSAPAKGLPSEEEDLKRPAGSGAGAAVPPRVARKVVFTAEMAKKLREIERAGEDHHDTWYHSALSARLSFER